MTLAVENLHAAYGEIEVLHGVSLAVEKGQIIALLGANGAGKSTTIKAIMGLLKPSAGRILLDGRDLSGQAAHLAARAGIALVPEGRKIFRKMTVEENLLVGGVVRSAAEVREQLADVYALFPRLGERRRQFGGTLSGGEQQMLAIGRALMSRPSFILMDEPSLGLAPLVVESVHQAIDRIRREMGIGGILVEQNVAVALSVAAYAYVLMRGSVVLEGDPKESRSLSATEGRLSRHGVRSAVRRRKAGDTMTNVDYELFAIRYATRDARRAAHFIGGDPHDGPMPMDYFVWVARGGGRTFVIDTGFNAEVSAQSPAHASCAARWSRCRLLGIDPDTVEDVILTHLHYDHVGNFDRFPKARFHLQERELTYATGRYMRYPRLSHSFEVGGRLRHRAAQLCEPRDVLRWRCGARAGPHRACSRRSLGRASIRPGQDHAAALSCSPPTSRTSTRTWRAAGRSRRPSISAKCWRVLTGCCSLHPDESHIVPGHDPLVMKLYPAPNPELEGVAVRLDVPPTGAAPSRADYSSGH